MESDALPAKRLRYSPESKHAPKPQVTIAKSEQGVEAAHMIQHEHSSERSSNSAASCIKAEAHPTAAKAGLGQALRATATPWTPAKLSHQGIVKQPSSCWDTGYGPAFFTNAQSLITASENAQAAFGTDIAAHFGQVWHALQQCLYRALSILQHTWQDCRTQTSCVYTAGAYIWQSQVTVKTASFAAFVHKQSSQRCR